MKAEKLETTERLTSAERDTGDLPAVAADGSPWPLRFKLALRRPEIGVVPVSAVIFTIFALMVPNSFLTVPVWGAIESLVSELGITAVAVTLLMIAGEFDLTVGSVLGLAAVMVPVMNNHGVNIWLAVAITMLTCGVIGLVNGLLVARVGLPSLIVTIGGLMFYRGVDYVVVGGNNVTMNNSAVAALVPFNKTWGSYSVEGIWFIVFACCAIFLLGRTQLGNWIFASGGNRNAALASGVPVRRVKMGLYILSALAAGLEGILTVARLVGVDGTIGTNIELEAILAVVVGGTAIHGGKGGVVGTIFGVLVLSMAEIGLILVGVPAYWYQAGIGLFLVVTVLTNRTVIERLLKST